MPSKNKQPRKKPPKLSAKQRMFCHEYMKDMNATQAAIRAGYSARSAGEIGFENLKKPQIEEFLAKETEKRVMSSHESKKMLSDMAKSSLNDYLVIKTVERPTRIKIPLAEMIGRTQAEIEFEDEYASEVRLSEKEHEAHLKAQKARTRSIIRMRLILKRDPLATQEVDGPLETVEVAEVDLVKLARDKELGRIKSLSYNNSGMPKVELYAADAALVNINRIHGNFEKDHNQAGKRQLSGTIQTQVIDDVDYESLPDNILEAIVAARKKHSDEEPSED